MEELKDIVIEKLLEESRIRVDWQYAWRQLETGPYFDRDFPQFVYWDLSNNDTTVRSLGFTSRYDLKNAMEACIDEEAQRLVDQAKDRKLAEIAAILLSGENESAYQAVARTARVIKKPISKLIGFIVANPERFFGHVIFQPFHEFSVTLKTMAEELPHAINRADIHPVAAKIFAERYGYEIPGNILVGGIHHSYSSEELAAIDETLRHNRDGAPKGRGPAIANPDRIKDVSRLNEVVIKETKTDLHGLSTPDTMMRPAHKPSIKAQRPHHD